jgi:hypothetical protein
LSPSLRHRTAAVSRHCPAGQRRDCGTALSRSAYLPALPPVSRCEVALPRCRRDWMMVLARMRFAVVAVGRFWRRLDAPMMNAASHATPWGQSRTIRCPLAIANSQGLTTIASGEMTLRSTSGGGKPRCRYPTMSYVLSTDMGLVSIELRLMDASPMYVQLSSEERRVRTFWRASRRSHGTVLNAVASKNRHAPLVLSQYGDNNLSPTLPRDRKPGLCHTGKCGLKPSRSKTPELESEWSCGCVAQEGCPRGSAYTGSSSELFPRCCGGPTRAAKS